MRRWRDVVSRGLPYVSRRRRCGGDRLLPMPRRTGPGRRIASRSRTRSTCAPMRMAAGVGRALLAELIDESARIGARQMVAVIGDSGQRSIDPPARRARLPPGGRALERGQQVRALARRRPDAARARPRRQRRRLDSHVVGGGAMTDTERAAASLAKNAANYVPLSPVQFPRAQRADLAGQDRRSPRNAGVHVSRVRSALPAACLRARPPRRPPRRHRCGDGAQRSGVARSALRGACARSGAQRAQLPARCENNRVLSRSTGTPAR